MINVLLLAKALHMTMIPFSFNVIDYGAKGDNKTDNTKAFRSALLAAKNASGGRVYVPSGLYILHGNLTIPPGVTLGGSYSTPPSHQLYTGKARLDDGSVLIPTGGRGSNGCGSHIGDLDCPAAFINIGHNAAVEGFVIFYAEQERFSTPVPYPWTFRLGGISDNQYSVNPALMDVEILGSWNGIAVVEGARHYIARVQGQPLNIGLFVDEIEDIGRIENVHFVPWFSQAAPLIYHQTTYGRAFVFGRTDWQYVLNTFAYAYAVGYHFIERPSGATNGNFVGIGMDAANNASVLVEQSKAYGISITNGEFTAFCDRGVPNFDHPHYFCRPDDPSVAPVHVFTGPKNQGSIKFVNCAFWGPAYAVSKLQGAGLVSFIGCNFEDWDNELNQTATGFVHNGTAAHIQLGGSSIITNSQFKRDGIQLFLGPNAQKSIFTGNIITGRCQVNSPSYTGKNVMRDNLDDS